LQDGGNPWAPAFRPGFREQRRAHRPFAPNAQRGEKTENQELPPGLSEERESGKRRIGENSEAQRAAAPQDISETSEEPTSERPAHEKGRLNPRTLFANEGIGCVRSGESQQ